MALPITTDTIVAIATAQGAGAVGIVRLSGQDAFAIAAKMFKPKHKHDVFELKGGRVLFGQIIESQAISKTEVSALEEASVEAMVDEALLLSFRAPHSYTAQDVIELQCHGGAAILRKVLDLCLEHGARLAQAGEFTLRAFLNGRIDLVQAESVLHLVNAQTDSARRHAALGLNKSLSEALDSIQSDITRVYGNIQAVFDYPDEGVPEAEFIAPLEAAISKIERLLATAKAGRLSQTGAKLALIGRPNVGKSSLLNALLGYERSIVSEVAGTTRDYLEAPLELEGVPIIAIDTAGIRTTQDSIEASGVELSKRIATNADLSVLLLDASQALSDVDEAFIHELMMSLAPERSLIVFNKIDLSTTDLKSANKLHRLLPEHKELLYISSKTGEGLNELKKAIHYKLLGDVNDSELWLSSERHAALLTELKSLLKRALYAPDDLAALELEAGLSLLAQITGRGEIAEETLEHIFANFCVGK